MSLSIIYLVILHIHFSLFSKHFRLFSDDPLLCISEDLICDGIRHCPLGGGMLSDEDDNLCKKHKIDDHDIRNVS